MPIEETGEACVRTDCFNVDVSICIQIKTQISIRERRRWDWEYTFCESLDSAAVQDCTKFPILLTNVLLQLVSDIINGVCYQRHVKRFEHQKGRPNVNVCAAEENLEEQL